MANFVALRQPVTILGTDFTNPDNLTDDLLMPNSLIKPLTLLSYYTQNNILFVIFLNSLADVENEMFKHQFLKFLTKLLILDLIVNLPIQHF